MNKLPDFRNDLTAVAENVSVGVKDMLQGLAERGQPRKVVEISESSVTKDRLPAAAESSQSESSSGSTSPEPSAKTRSPVQRKTKSSVDEERPKMNFTTRLFTDTKELLEQSKLRQQLQKLTPDDYEDIIDVALHDWFRKMGYAKKRFAQE